MKYKEKENYYTCFLLLMLFPTSVLAASMSSSMSFGAILNDLLSTNNLSMVIIGLVVIVIILVGSTIFSSRR